MPTCLGIEYREIMHQRSFIRLLCLCCIVKGVSAVIRVGVCRTDKLFVLLEDIIFQTASMAHLQVILRTSVTHRYKNLATYRQYMDLAQ